ncbi:hypothetical protein GCM10011571_16830 [Marinithermofilum abyssi]|uniref:HTH gntR-type domain-containing protein n=1 Tax=Marinithermofilum abyssi TaxID=1571185 RepID=A0A8J2VHT9_9BACL|nr:hypothetical protein GCM10011571_16830 [Marinithermofilum abyssi]
MIDKSSPVPIYYQLEEHIKSQIEKGELKPGDCLPSEREYSEKYGISRMTVRQAINNLVSDGYLIRQKGKGTFVSERKFEQKLSELTSFTEDMKARGLKPDSKLLQFEIIPSDDAIATQLSIKRHDPVYQIRRIRLADGVPMAQTSGPLRDESHVAFRKTELSTYSEAATPICWRRKPFTGQED